MGNEMTEFASDDGKVIDIINPVTVFDIARFDQVMRVATVMASASIIPDHLKIKDDRGIDFEATRGNCFVVANLAANWGLDPFQVAQASAMVFGKIVLEGKLVRAVIRKFLGFDLHYAFFGEEGNMERRVYVSDKPLVKAGLSEPIQMSEPEIKEAMSAPGFRITSGTLKKWHTKNKSGGINDNWGKDEQKMFRERGSREWCREFAPGLMLGVYTPDEFDELDGASRSNRAREVNPASNPLLDDRRSVPMERVDQKTGEVTTEKNNRTNQSEKQSSARAPRNADGEENGGRDNGQDTTAPRVEAAVFEAFSNALMRYSSSETLQKANRSFWNESGGMPKHRDQYNLGGDIYHLHDQRVAGMKNIEETKDAVAALIAEAFKL